MSGIIHCENVHFSSFRWDVAKVLPECCPWWGSGSPVWRDEGQGAEALRAQGLLQAGGTQRKGHREFW